MNLQAFGDMNLQAFLRHLNSRIFQLRAEIEGLEDLIESTHKGFEWRNVHEITLQPGMTYLIRPVYHDGGRGVEALYQWQGRDGWQHKYGLTIDMHSLHHYLEVLI